MKSPVKRALSSLERARQHLDHPHIKPDFHSILNDLMHELVDHGGLRKSGQPLLSQAHGNEEQCWLYALLEALTETCISLAENPAEAESSLRQQIDQGILDCRKRLTAGRSDS